MKQLLRKIAKKKLDALCFLLLLPSYCRPQKTLNHKKIHKILLINLQGIGDILMTTPFLSALRENYPSAQIDYCCYNKNSALLEGDRRINNLIKRKEEKIWSKDFLVTFRGIRKEHYDLVINLFPAQHSALLTVLSNADYKLGHLYSTACTSNNLKIQPPNPELPTPNPRLQAPTWDVRENCKNIAEQLGFFLPYPANLSINIDKEIERRIRNEIKKREIIAIHPFANWISKQWPKECWQQLIKRIVEDKRYNKYSLAVIGTEKDKEEAKALIEIIDKKRRENWCGKHSLKELAAALKQATVLITTDTGPMHIALAVQTRTIGLFGVTNPDILVSGAKNIEIVSSYKQCPEKFRFNHNNEPPDWKQSCMKRISVDAVFEKIEKCLEEKEKKSSENE